MLVAGFPCQSFSNAGRKLAFDDDRGQLFYELVRLATACRFRALLLENVRGLLHLLTYSPTEPITLFDLLNYLIYSPYRCVVYSSHR